MDDERIDWIRRQVFLALDIKEDEVFEELLDRDDGVWERELGKFLNDTPEENESSVLFYKITKEEEEEVEVECEPEIPDITTEEEGAEGENTEQQQQQGDAAAAEDSEPKEQALGVSTPTGEEETPRKGTSGKKKRKGSTPTGDKIDTEEKPEVPPTPDVEKEKTEGEDEEGEEKEEEEEDKAPRTKIILQKVIRTYLYACYQHLPEEYSDQDCVYFLRNTPGMVPLPTSKDEAQENLPNYFEIGMLNGHSLVMLDHIISQVYMPLLSYNQHRHGEGKSDSRSRPDTRASHRQEQQQDSEDAKPDKKEKQINVIKKQQN